MAKLEVRSRDDDGDAGGNFAIRLDTGLPEDEITSRISADGAGAMHFTLEQINDDCVADFRYPEQSSEFRAAIDAYFAKEFASAN